MKSYLFNIALALISLAFGSIISAGEVEDRSPERFYLASVELSDFAEYRQVWQSKLYVTPGAARMVILPSFEPELAVSLDVRYRRGTSFYYLTLTRASQSIWQSMPENGGHGGAIAIDRLEAEVASDLARAILGVWRQMLVQTEPEAQSPIIVLDGTHIEFSTLFDGGHQLHAQLPDHPSEAGQALADIGYALIRYCESSTTEKSQYVRDIRERVKTLQGRLGTKGSVK